MADKDLFGFDELEKSFNGASKKLKEKEDALLTAAANNMIKKLKQQTPVSGKVDKKGKTGNLRRGWRKEQIKTDSDGKSLRVKNAAPHSHLYEYGHESVVPYTRNKKPIKVNAGKRTGKGPKGKYLLNRMVKKEMGSFTKEVEKMYDKVTEDIQI